jgi:signal transduction histidine kinase
MIKLDHAAADGALEQTVRESVGDLEAVLHDVREVGQGLYPSLLTEQGIAAALEGVRQRTPGRLRVESDGVGRYSSEVESAVYYCCLEAIQNATKHSGPGSQIMVTLREEDDVLRFDVTDDGAGFDPEVSSGTGLQNMQDRMGALGGRLTVTAAPGQGVTVTGRVPPGSASAR